jgi:hypothetical protein
MVVEKPEPRFFLSFTKADVTTLSRMEEKTVSRINPNLLLKIVFQNT